MNIAETLKDLRKSRDLTQKQLAQIIGVSQSSIYIWEKGTSEPSASAAYKIAEYFDVSIPYLLGIDTEITPTTQIARPDDAVTPEEQILLNKLRKIPPTLQDQAFDYLDAFLETTIKRYHLSDPGDQEA